MIAFFLLDTITPLGMAVGITYILVISLLLISRDIKLILLYAVIGTIATVVGFFLSPPGIEVWKAVFNRVLSIVAIWFITIIGIKQVKAEENFHLVTESATTALIMVEKGGEISLVNSQAEILFGYTQSELLGQPIEILIPERFRTKHVVYRNNFFLEPKTRALGTNRDLSGRKKDGTEVPIEIGLNPIKTTEGISVLASVVDITARKKAEEIIKTKSIELEKSNKELEHFAYVASHDLQEPLRMVASYTQLLAKKYSDELDDNAREYISFAVDGVKRMQQLIDDLLKYSRIGTQRKSPEIISCKEIIDTILKDMKLTINETGTKVTFSELPEITGDKVQLTQLFQNLIANAIKYGKKEETPQINISYEKKEGEYLFSVQDNGIGFDKQFAHRIFVIFQRLHTRQEYPGTGIGLAICKKIVEQHAGKIWVDSEPGKGSTFYFTLPTKEKHEFK